MKNGNNENSVLLALIASLLLAIGTEWSRASKVLVILSALTLAGIAVQNINREIKK